MDRRKLSPNAEVLRKEIKDMIPESTSHEKPNPEAELIRQDENKNRVYGGELLESKTSALVQDMNVGENWKPRLVYWPKPTKLLNERKQGYLIPLTDIYLTPGGPLHEGEFIYITNEPIMSPGAVGISLYPV